MLRTCLEDVRVKSIKRIIPLKYMLELVLMSVLYMMLETSGAKKYGIVLVVCAIFFFLGRKNSWSADAMLCVVVPPIIYIFAGGISTLFDLRTQITSIKEIFFWLIPIFFAFSQYTYYGESMSRIVDIQFWASCIGYLYPRLRFILEHSNSESTYAFVFGAFTIYYAYQKKWGKLLVAIFLMYLSNKRIAMLAVAVSLMLSLILWIFKKSKEVLMVMWGCVSAGVFYYIFLIHSGLLRYFCNRLGIDSKGRVQIYARFSEMYDFSPTFLGNGLGCVENILDNWQIRYYGNLHNDLLKFYFEVGFIGLIIFLVSYGLSFLIIGQRFGKAQMCFIFTIITYFIVLCATDNVSIYILYLIPMYSMMFAVLSKRNDETC